MHVEILPGFGDNYIYLVLDSGSAAAVDPGAADPVLSAVRKLGAELSLVLVTHHHFDHTGGCRELKTVTGCSIAGPGGTRAGEVDRTVRDGDVVSVGDCEFRVLSVPGHTGGHVAYYCEAGKLLFTGDTLFAGGCGRVFGGTAAEMWNSLQKIRALPGETLIYCGHEYTLENLEFAAHLEPDNREVAERLAEVRRQCAAGKYTVPSTLELERVTNPFLRADTEALQEAVGLAGAPPAEVFAEMRRRKDRW